MDDSPPPDKWAELTEEERKALIEMARGHMFWRQALARFHWLGKLAQVALAIAAAWVLFKDGLGAWIQGIGK